MKVGVEGRLAHTDTNIELKQGEATLGMLWGNGRKAFLHGNSAARHRNFSVSAPT